MQICDVDYEKATGLLAESGSHVKTAIVMGLKDCTKEEARALLEKADGKIKAALK
jgi:N-acetylmuramic acid 6-phosphate (MurNAc-6-P) etherase